MPECNINPFFLLQCEINYCTHWLMPGHNNKPHNKNQMITFEISCVSVAKNIFRVSSVDPSHGQSHTLHVNDVYHKQQWLNCLRTAMTQQQGAPVTLQQEEPVRANRRSSTISNEETDENCPPVSGPKLRPQKLSKTRLDRKLQGSLKRKETGV